MNRDRQRRDSSREDEAESWSSLVVRILLLLGTLLLVFGLVASCEYRWQKLM